MAPFGDTNNVSIAFRRSKALTAALVSTPASPAPILIVFMVTLSSRGVTSQIIVLLKKLQRINAGFLKGIDSNHFRNRRLDRSQRRPRKLERRNRANGSDLVQQRCDHTRFVSDPFAGYPFRDDEFGQRLRPHEHHIRQHVGMARTEQWIGAQNLVGGFLELHVKPVIDRRFFRAAAEFRSLGTSTQAVSTVRKYSAASSQ